MEEQSIDVRALDGDQQIQRNKTTVDPAEQIGENVRRTSATNVECAWDTELREFQLAVRLNGEWETVDVALEADTDCVFDAVQIAEEDFFYFRVGSCDKPSEDDNICSAFENELEL
ncbi:hypothetical protein [Natronorubrum sp. A-ect3]|uniref:hypothetical protein n=1 Tax=Natronorubrum sp. A-ect3 TaxID=3242698 RepID=UPI00359DE016